MAQLGRARIRQKPLVATGDEKAGETCPEHGPYATPRAALDAVRKVQGADPATARALLEYAAVARRTCPACGGLHPSGPDWARAVRERAAHSNSSDLQ